MLERNGTSSYANCTMTSSWDSPEGTVRFPVRVSCSLLEVATCGLIALRLTATADAAWAGPAKARPYTPAAATRAKASQARTIR